MLDIIYEDKDKIILNKPAGQLSQSGKSFEMDLVSEVLTYRKSKGEDLTVLYQGLCLWLRIKRNQQDCLYLCKKKHYVN